MVRRWRVAIRRRDVSAGPAVELAEHPQLRGLPDLPRWTRRLRLHAKDELLRPDEHGLRMPERTKPEIPGLGKGDVAKAPGLVEHGAAEEQISDVQRHIVLRHQRKSEAVRLDDHRLHLGKALGIGIDCAIDVFTVGPHKRRRREPPRCFAPGDLLQHRADPGLGQRVRRRKWLDEFAERGADGGVQCVDIAQAPQVQRSMGNRGRDVGFDRLQRPRIGARVCNDDLDIAIGLAQDRGKRAAIQGVGVPCKQDDRHQRVGQRRGLWNAEKLLLVAVSNLRHERCIQARQRRGERRVELTPELLLPLQAESRFRNCLDRLQRRVQGLGGMTLFKKGATEQAQRFGARGLARE